VFNLIVSCLFWRPKQPSQYRAFTWQAKTHLGHTNPSVVQRCLPTTTHSWCCLCPYKGVLWQRLLRALARRCCAPPEVPNFPALGHPFPSVSGPRFFESLEILAVCREFASARKNPKPHGFFCKNRRINSVRSFADFLVLPWLFGLFRTLASTRQTAQIYCD